MYKKDRFRLFGLAGHNQLASLEPKQTDEGSIKSNNHTQIITAACIAGILFAVNIVVTFWYYQTVAHTIEWYSKATVYATVARFHVLSLAIGVLIAALHVLLNSAKKEWYVLPAYAALLLFSAYLALFGMHGRYLGPGVTYYAPEMMYAVLFVLPYIVVKYTGKKWHKLFVLLISFTAPVIIVVSGTHSLSVGFTLCVLFAMLMIRRTIPDNKDLLSRAGVLCILIVMLAAFFAFSKTSIIGTLLTRIEVFASGGNVDPTGSGYMYRQLLKGLKETPVIGPSGYSVAIHSSYSVPAYAFFAKQDDAYAVAAVILRWGWFSGVIMVGLSAALMALLFSISRSTKDDYAKCLSSSVALLFAIKTAISLVSCFGVFLSGAAMPMIGPFGAVVDMTLFISAMSLCVNSSADKTV